MPAILRVVIQRTQSDCAVAVLSMLTGMSYEEILLLVGQRSPKVLTKGMWTAQILRIAAACGLKLTKQKHFDLDDDQGILCLYDHVVVLKNGLVIDPADGAIWEAELYLTTCDEEDDPLLLRLIDA